MHTIQQSLILTIINLTQNFVDSNNVNLLQPIGQFGTRLNVIGTSSHPMVCGVDDKPTVLLFSLVNWFALPLGIRDEWTASWS